MNCGRQKTFVSYHPFLVDATFLTNPLCHLLHMGIGVIVHGYISSAGWPQENCRQLLRHNQRVLRALPDVDTEWPFFTRSMFSCLPLRNKLAVTIPQYENLVISFGASYKNMYALEAAWIRKFETLLSKLVWNHAEVYVAFNKLRYEWTISSSEMHYSLSKIRPMPPRQWELQCYRQETSPLTYEQAINGPYIPLFKMLPPTS